MRRWSGGPAAELQDCRPWAWNLLKTARTDSAPTARRTQGACLRPQLRTDLGGMATCGAAGDLSATYLGHWLSAHEPNHRNPEHGAQHPDQSQRLVGCFQHPGDRPAGLRRKGRENEALDHKNEPQRDREFRHVCYQTDAAWRAASLLAAVAGAVIALAARIVEVAEEIRVGLD